MNLFDDDKKEEFGPQPETPVDQYKRESEDNSAIEDARKEAARKKMYTGIIQGLSTAFGGKAHDDSFYEGLKQDQDAQVSQVQKDKQARLDRILNKYKLDRSVIGDEREDIKFGQEQTDRQRADDTFQRKTSLESEETQLAQSLAKKMLPSVDFSGYTAAQIEERFPQIGKIVSQASAKKGVDNFYVKDMVIKHPETGELGRYSVQLNKSDPKHYKILGESPFALGTLKDQKTGSTRTIDRATGETSGPIDMNLADPERGENDVFNIMQNLPPDHEKFVDTINKEFRAKTDNLTNARQAMNSINELLKKAEAGEKLDKAAFANPIARMSGVKGVASDRDIQPFLGTPEALERLNQYATELISGQVTEENIEYFRNFTDAYGKALESNYNTESDQYRRAIMAKTGLDENKADLVLHKYKTQESPVEDNTPMTKEKWTSISTDERIKIVKETAKEYGISIQEAAQAIKEQLGLK